MSERKALSKKTRFEVFKRDGFTCQYCGAPPTKSVLHVDHIGPVALGGTNDIDNLITACAECNLGKGATPLSSHPAALADRGAEVAEREAQIAAYNEIMRDKRERTEADMWSVAEALTPGAESGYPRSGLSSIRTFVDLLGVEDALDAASIARNRFPRSDPTAFRYFCGICWKRIKGEG